jgi:hypothetical protein
MTHKLILKSHREELRLGSAWNIVIAPVQRREAVRIDIGGRKLLRGVCWSVYTNIAMHVLVAVIGVGEVYEEPLVQKLVSRAYLKGMHNLWA